MSQVKIALIVVLVLSFTFSLIPYLLPVPANTASPMSFRFDVAIISFIGLLHIGGGFLFLFGLKNFKTAFKQVYYLICAGGMINGFFWLDYPLSRYLHVWQGWFQLYTGDIPTSFSFVLVYLGIRKFARLMNLRNFFTSYKLFLALFFVLEIILWFIPHQRPFKISELHFDLLHCITFVEVFFTFIATGLVFEIRKAASSTYSRALLWFALALIFDGLACAYYISYDYIVFPSWLPEETTAVLYIINGFLLITAGYSFSTMNSSPSNQTKGNSTIDIIVYMVSLASNFEEINPYLEPMRVITASMGNNEILSPSQEKELVKVYQNLENYLITKEPLHNYTVDSLRENIVSRFNRIPS